MRQTRRSLGLDRSSYEIDLSEQQASELREVLARYISAARRIGGGKRHAVMSTTPPEENPAEIRAWAQGGGIEVSSRGRIRAELREQYRSR